jgi:hypothetical protein
MHKWMAIGLSAVLAACSATGPFFGPLGAEETSRPAAATDPAPQALDARGLGVYLDMMRRLIEGDAVEQAETFRRVQQEADASPTTTNRLKLALALAVPNQPASDPKKAAELLSALLSDNDALLAEERVLATIELNDVQQRLVLDAAAEQIKRDAEEQRARQNTEESQRLEAALEENRKLKAQLDDALAKLDAITTIEQSIRKRESADAPN